MFCRFNAQFYNIQLWYSTTNFTAAVGAQVRNSNNGWVQATTSDSITGTCPSDFAPVAITGLNIPLTLGIKTGLSARDMGNSRVAFYNNADANDVRPITSTDGRTVLYYASGGADFGGSPDTIAIIPRTPLREIVIEFPST